MTPANAINRAGGKWKAKLIHMSGFTFFLDPAIQDLIGPSDLIILQRNLVHERVFAAMRYWQGLGKPVVVDLDDAYQMLPWSNTVKQFWHLKDGGENMRMMLDGLRISSGLVSPNRLLLSDLSPWANGYYLQNYADNWWLNDTSDRDEMREERELSGKIVIGWGGSLSHYDSFWGSGLLDAIPNITARHPEVVWMICGGDKRPYDLLDVPSRNKFMQGGVPAEKWPEIVRLFDIGVAPLFGPYDQRRSWIKGIEYLLAGVPWIGQEGEVYKDLDQLGTLIPPTTNDWEDALEFKIENLKTEQEAAQALVPRAQELFIADNQLSLYEQVYKKIIRDFSDEKVNLPDIMRLAPEESGDQNGKDITRKAEAKPGVPGAVEREPA